MSIAYSLHFCNLRNVLPIWFKCLQVGRNCAPLRRSTSCGAITTRIGRQTCPPAFPWKSTAVRGASRRSRCRESANESASVQKAYSEPRRFPCPQRRAGRRKKLRHARNNIDDQHPPLSASEAKATGKTPVPSTTGNPHMWVPLPRSSRGDFLPDPRSSSSMCRTENRRC